MNYKRLFLDVHVIQTVPPSNINRDDTGSPKTAQYGGVRRARVSSQSWKRAIRKYFNEFGGLTNIGIRTLDVVQHVADKIMEIDGSITKQKAKQMAKELFERVTMKKDGKGKKSFQFDKNDKLKALFFLSDKQAKQLAEAAIRGETESATIKGCIKKKSSIDIALFGRMLAEDPSLNEDASAQVAHAISTHGVQTEYDFFTAVDDLSPEEHAGAAMLDTVEYNSSTLYRYANVAVHELLAQLGDSESTVNALKLFVDAFAVSMPTGKINTFANQTLPQLILVTLRDDRPVNLVTAFENPVRSGDGYVKESVSRLFEEHRRVHKFLAQPYYVSYVVADADMENSGVGISHVSMQQLLQELGEAIEGRLPGLQE